MSGDTEKPEKKKSGRITMVEIDSYIENFRKKYKYLKNFPHNNILFNRDTINIIPTKLSGTIKYKCTIYDKNNHKDLPISYELTHKNHILMAKYYPQDDTHILFVFYKDYEIFKQELKKIDVYYPIGNYSLKTSYASFNLVKHTLSDEKAPILNENLEESIKKDIKKFFTKRDFYNENKLTFKRGILLYGPPGNGKTALIRTILKNNPDCYGIIITAQNFDSGSSKYLRDTLNDKKKIIIFEDIDGFERHMKSTILNFLDGTGSLENTFVIATTNRIEEVGDVLKDRPSRFDKVYQITLPNQDTREKLLKRFFPKLKGDELEEYIKLTKDFSGAYFKELFIFVNIHECSIKSAISKIKKQVKLYKDYGDKSYLG